MINPINVWNIRQLANKVLGKPPIDCHYPQSKVLCDGCEPGEIFQCPVCKRLRAYCWGCDDDYFELCDECTVDKYREENEEVIA